MKRLMSICLTFAVICACTFSLNANASSNAPSKIINVVYDDSGSMYFTNNVKVDTWCQAKYSMEVFAAMLGEKDKMNVYYMSDYEKETIAEPRITLDGKDGAEANVAKIHNQKNVAGNTPFNSVKKAYSDLEEASADEKWLVILTDGEFQGVDGKEGIDSFLAQKPADIKVMFLGMGAKAAEITEKQEESIYCVSAQTSGQILNNITDICTRIFNSNKLEINVSAKTISFDVPMGELIVFAQGANVSINGIQRADGSLVQSSRTPVEVKYSECDVSNYDNEPVIDLLGKIATFKDDFPVGDYTLDVSGAETIEIYYKPNIEVAAYLTDNEGNEIGNLSDLAAGEYTITFGFVKAGTKEKVRESSLLGNVIYEALVTNNGKKHDTVYSDGDKVILEEGSLSIDVTAEYLEYNSVSTSLNYSIYKDKSITFSVVDDPSYTIVSDGFANNDYIKIAAQIDGRGLTEEQWESMETPQIQYLEDSSDFKIDSLTIEKTADVGIFRVWPSLPKNKPSTGTYTDCDYQITYHQMFGNETWQGDMQSTLKIADTRLWWERNWDLVVKLLILLVILIILAGYLPFFKHYLPKSLKRKPYIKCIPSEPGEKRKDRNGMVEKNLLSTIIPYVPQTGTIKYVPKGVTGCPIMAVRAVKRRRMVLTNMKSFVGKDNITFDGEAIKKELKKFETGAGVSIRVKRGEWTYVCNPNQENK